MKRLTTMISRFKEKNMEYDELIDKIKDALKITRELEIYENADL